MKKAIGLALAVLATSVVAASAQGRPTVAAATSLRATGSGAPRFHSGARGEPAPAEAPPRPRIPIATKTQARNITG